MKYYYLRVGHLDSGRDVYIILESPNKHEQRKIGVGLGGEGQDYAALVTPTLDEWREIETWNLELLTNAALREHLARAIKLKRGKKL